MIHPVSWKFFSSLLDIQHQASHRKDLTYTSDGDECVKFVSFGANEINVEINVVRDKKSYMRNK